MNKAFLCIIFAVFFVGVSSAQVEQDAARIDHGGFGAFNTSFRTINNKFAFFTGGGGGFIIHNFRIGAFYSGLSNSFSDKDEENITFKLGCSHGGLWFAYPFYTRRDYHPIIDFKASYGTVRLINTNWLVMDNSNFFNFELGFGMEYKWTDIFYLAGGIIYQYNHFLKEIDYYPSSGFNSFGIYVSFKLGSFDGVYL